MTGKPCHLLALPREIRDEIYHIIIEQRLRIPWPLKTSPPIPEATTYREKPTAFLSDAHTLVSSDPVSQVKKQMRAEFSDLLRTLNVHIVVRVKNFDFTTAIKYLNDVRRERQEVFHVREDGTSTARLKIQLVGPYDGEWKSNLKQWIDQVEKWVSLEGELVTAHRTLQQCVVTKCYCIRVPRASLFEVYYEYQAHQRGAGRLELDKIFYTLLSRYRAEKMMMWHEGLHEADGSYDARLLTFFNWRTYPKAAEPFAGYVFPPL